MLNEWEEFRQYTGKLKYTSARKSDNSFLGRFTFDTIMKFEGLARVLTIIARGYLFHDRDGSTLTYPDNERIAYAGRALLAWCSIPDTKKAAPKEAWQYESDFRWLHDEFPELVKASGKGWFYTHVHAVKDYIIKHQDMVMQGYIGKAKDIKSGFDKEWRKRVVQLQISLLDMTTKGAWVIKLEGIIAEALELGSLRKQEVVISDSLWEQLHSVIDRKVPDDIVSTLIGYYIANRQEDTDWVVLPVSSFDAYFGTTSFGRRWLGKIPESVMKRSDQCLGVSRYLIKPEYLDGAEIID